MSEDFLCLNELKKNWDSLNIMPYPHQIRSMDRVINELGGRALIADEVGLGKTFEAGMILKEYMLRGQVINTLILTPASLVNQWYNELNSKFEMEAYVNYHPGCWQYSNCTIASIDTAKREEHAKDLLAIKYDLIIVDEAHKLKNDRTLNYQLVKNLQTKFLLLLTATPIQNDLKELYNLISLVKPDLLGSYRGFKIKYIKDKCIPKNSDLLRVQLQQVMVRNNRKNVNLDLPVRKVQLYPLELSDKEQVFYNAVTDMVRREYLKRVTEKQSILNLITLQREICSSTFAAESTLQKMKTDQPADSPWRENLEELCLIAQNIKENKKYNVIKNILKKEITLSSHKVIIFTEYLATQDYICRRLAQDGYDVIKFNGHLGVFEKNSVLEKFAYSKQVMVSTESGGEGLNLQFCNIIINYDLPWNPMRVEQRIGRVHRLGQRKAVQIYNLCTKNTIEELILTLLFKKINMFEKVIGGLELILHKLDTEKSIESRIMDLIVTAPTNEQLASNIESLGHKLQQDRLSYCEQENAGDALWGAY